MKLVCGLAPSESSDGPGVIGRSDVKSGALNTYPVYARNATRMQLAAAQDAIRAVLPIVEKQYSQIAGQKLDDLHMQFIVETADQLSGAHCVALHNGRFRIGIAQKLVNLHLKYLWTAALIPEPPHCPLDGIIRDIT